MNSNDRSVQFRSEHSDWQTLSDLFSGLNFEFSFELDVCATAENAKCKRYFSPDEDGLKQPWHGRCWMIPPYGREIAAWMQKAFQAAQSGATVVCLVPARMDTKWWHTYVTRASEIRYLRGRVGFDGAPNSAPLRSAIVIFRPPPIGWADEDIQWYVVCERCGAKVFARTPCVSCPRCHLPLAARERLPVPWVNRSRRGSPVHTDSETDHPSP